jgi:hypothetical protein
MSHIKQCKVSEDNSLNTLEYGPESVGSIFAVVAAKVGKVLIDVLVEGRYQYKLWSTKVESYLYPDITEILPEIWHGFYSVPNIPNQLKIDFLENRFPALKKPLSNAYYDFFMKLITGEQMPVVIPTEKQILNMIVKTALIYNVRDHHADKTKAILDLSNIVYLDSFAGNLNIVKVEFDKKYLYQNKLRDDELGVILYSKHGDVYNPENNIYALAKLDFLNVAATHYLLIDHTYTHFNFVDAICSLHYNMRHDSMLYQLLAPHTRFTLGINDVIFRDASSPVSNSDSLFHRYTSPIQTVPAILDAVIKVNEWTLNGYYSEDIEQRKFKCVPEFNLQGVSINHIPQYLKALSDYYKVIRKFVTELVIKDETISSSSNSLRKQMEDMVSVLPNYFRFMSHDKDCQDPINVISKFIWGVSVAHNVMHYSAYVYLQDLQFDVNGAAKPSLTSFKITRDLRDCNESTKPEEIVDQIYGIGSTNFAKTFLTFNHNPDIELDFTMKNLQYNFSNGFQHIVDMFKGDLVGVEAQYPDFCPLNEMAQSICY